MNTHIQNFAFDEHLVRIVMRDGEPWFVGNDVCRALALKNTNQSLSRLHEDEKGVHTVDPLAPSKRGGGAQETTIVSEPGLYRLIFSSRKEEAERFKRWIAHDVLPAIRKNGFYAVPRTQAEISNETEFAESGPERRHAIEMVREYRLLFGHEYARHLWRKLGLPHITTLRGPLDELRDSGEACLSLLLNHKFLVDEEERSIWTEIDEALARRPYAKGPLAAQGVIVDPEMDGIYVANRGWGISMVFTGSAWDNGKWIGALRSLIGPDANHGKRFYFSKDQVRSTFVPAELIEQIL